MRYKNNPANGFQDIFRKQNTVARPDMVMIISPAPTLWSGDKKLCSWGYRSVHKPQTKVEGQHS